MGVRLAPTETGFFEDEERRRQVFALLDLGWPSLPERVAAADRAGFHWTRLSRPFAVFEEGRALAHAGVVELEAQVAGAHRRIAGIHAVCVHPDFRGRGYCRTVLDAALDWCDARFDTVLLFSSLPALYRRFHFRIVPQHRFTLPVNPAPGRMRFRALSGGRPADCATLRAALAARAPVSQVYGPVKAGELFGLNEILMRRRIERVFWWEERQALAAFDQIGATLKIYDLAAPQPILLPELLEATGGGCTRVESWFTPDLLGEKFHAVPHHAGGDLLMVRGPFAAEDRPFIVPPHARC